MKQLLENWKRFLNEYHPGYGKSFEKNPRQFPSISSDMSSLNILEGPITLGPSGRYRNLVIVQTSDGPVGFYQSSGTNTPEGWRGMFLPTGGLTTKDGESVDHISKMSFHHPQVDRDKTSKYPAVDSELYRIGKMLQKKFGSDLRMTGVPLWRAAKEPNAQQSSGEFASVAGKEFNRLLQKHGALSPNSDGFKSEYGRVLR